MVNHVVTLKLTTHWIRHRYRTKYPIRAKNVFTGLVDNLQGWMQIVLDCAEVALNFIVRKVELVHDGKVAHLDRLRLGKDAILWRA